MFSISELARGSPYARPGSIRGGGVAVLVLALLAIPHGWAPAAQSEPEPAPHPRTAELTPETLEARLKELQNLDDPRDETKNELSDLYRKAIEQLRIARDWKEKAQGFEETAREAPALLEAIRKELSSPREKLAPALTPPATLTQLEQALSQAEAELSAAQKELRGLDSEQKNRGDRRLAIPDLLAAAGERLEELTTKSGSPPVANDSQELEFARRALRSATKQATTEQINAHEKELSTYAVRGDLLTALRDQAALRVANREKQVKLVRDLVDERRRVEAEKQAREARRAAAQAHPSVGQLAEENAVLARRRTELSGRLEGTSRKLDEVKNALVELQEDFSSLVKKAEVAGLRDSIGLLLRKQKAALAHRRGSVRALDSRTREISDLQLDLIDLQDRLAALSDVGSRVTEILATIDLAGTGARREDIEAELRLLLQTRRTYLESLASDYDRYFNRMVDLAASERQFLEEIASYSAYIDERVLWIRSAAPLRPRGLPAECWEAALWLVSADGWARIAASVSSDLGRNRSLYALALAVFLLLVLLQIYLRRKLSALGKLASATRASLLPTLGALLVTVLIAVCGPSLLWFFAWRLGSLPDAGELGRAASSGLLSAAAILLTLETLRQACRASGVGEAHFGWNRSILPRLRKDLLWFTPVLLPAVFLTSTLEAQGTEAHKESLGRVAFIVGQLCLAVFLKRVLQPTRGVFSRAIDMHPGGWLSRLRFVWYPLAVGAPIALCATAVSGFYYTSLQLASRLQTSLLLLLAIILVQALVLRWLLLLRRKLAIAQARERLATLPAQRQLSSQQHRPPPEGDGANHHEPEVDLSSINRQTGKLVRTFAGCAFVVGIWLTWVDVVPALGILRQVHLGWSKTIELSTTESQLDEHGAARVVNKVVEKDVPVTLVDLMFAVLIGALALIAAKNLSGLLQITLLQHLPLDHGARYAFAATFSYLVTVIGVVFAFNALGVGWTKVQWLLAALTVGLGFGLQEIFANFVSGLIILFERPVRIGDTVTVGDVTGTVSQIRIRATVIIDWDRKELLVPNKEFISGRVVNWTLTDPITRIIVEVGVAYGSDVERARRILLQVARENPSVLDEPEPRALFLGFGDSSLNFSLRVFIRSIEQMFNVLDELHSAIDTEFRRSGIEIAFPQRDLHVRSIVPAGVEALEEQLS